jgi:carboxymethylenebutenolidase
VTGHSRTRRRGAASHVAVGAIGLAAGVGMAWGVGRQPLRDAVTTHGEWVYVKKRGQTDSVRAYIAYPERKDRAAAVVVIHELYGLTDWEPTVADRLAKSGYVAIVPDLLSSKYGRSPADADSGRKLVGQLEPSRITADLDAVVAYLNGLSAVRGGDIGVMGFCWGGGQAFRYTTNNPKLRAAVVCYGPPPENGALARIQTPLLGVYGENDARINSTLPNIADRLKGMGKSFTYRVYPGTGHGFLKPGRQGSDGPQVDKAWGDILDFFKQKLDTKNVNGKQ